MKFNNYNKLDTFIMASAVLLLLSGCIGKNNIEVTLKKPSQAVAPKATISNIQIINHQIVITGTNLNTVSNFKIQEGATTTNLQIESQTATSLIANSISNVTFAAGRIFDFILSDASAAATFTVNFSLCDSTLGGKGFNCTLTPNDKEVLSYDAASGLWKPRAVNGLSYQGAWDATTAQPVTAVAGDYYIVSVANAPYAIGDWIVFNGTTYDHINNSTLITSVYGRTGAVVATKGDYTITKLGDVDTTTTPPVANQVLKFNGTNWVPGTIVTTESDPTVTAFAKAALPTCGAGQVLKGDGTSLSCVIAAVPFSGTANRAVLTDATGALGVSAVTNTELGYLSGVTSSIQTQLNAKLGAETDPSVLAFAKTVLPTCLAGEVLKSNGISFSCVTDNTGAGAYTGPINSVVITNGTTGALTTSAVTNTELGYVSGATSSIQTQLNAKQASITTASALTAGSVQTNLQGALQVNPYGAVAGNTGEARFYELAANGANYTGFKSPDALAANLLYVMPSVAPTAGQVLSSDASNNLSWIAIPSAPVSSVFGRTGAVVATAGDYTGAKITNVAAGNIAATDVQTAINELDTEKQSIASLSASVQALVLSTYTLGANAVIAATDSIVGAFGKLQAQISANTTAVGTKADTTNAAQSITASNINTTTINGGVIPDLSKAITNEGGAPSIQIGTLAARPAAIAANTGRMYVANDAGNEAIYVSSGTAWIKIAQNGLSGTVAIANGGTGSTAFTANKAVVVNAGATALVDGPSIDDTTAVAATLVKRGPAGEVYGQYIVPSTTVTENAACTAAIGTIAKDSAGNILTCQ